MLNFVICDDSPEFCADLRTALADVMAGEEYRLSMFCSAKELTASASKLGRTDIAFLDIEFGDSSGIKTAEMFFSGKGTQVIFVTNYVDYCSDVYETEHAYFMRKPVSEEQLKKALDIARSRLEAADEKLSFKMKRGMVCYKPAEIKFFESNYRKVMLHADNGVAEFYSSLSEIDQQTGDQFNQCHKSFIVNFDRVTSMERDHFVLDSGENVPISRSMADETREKFFRYLRKG